MTAILAHGGELTGPHDLWSSWSWDPLVLAAIVASCWWYHAGVHALWRSAGHGGVVSRARAASFALAIVVIVVALVSPSDAASDALFSVHMTQHVLLTLVAAPLLVVSAPLQVMAWGLPPTLRRAVGRWQGRVRRLLAQPALPGIGLAVFTAVFTLWHLPVLYDAAITNDTVHALEHATMLGSALAFWAPIVQPRRTHQGFGVLLLFISMIASGILSALLVFAPTAWYTHDDTLAWGLTRLQDQQAAGAVMWVLGGTIYVVAGAVAMMRWLHSDEQAARRVEHRRVAPRRVTRARH
ncbi:MAG: cytochrome c oxidase assembly protein [Actinobacteria bacterium]|nr:cytochrome c oxidase assembly protein [Actinomycetota bacterium]